MKKPFLFAIALMCMLTSVPAAYAANSTTYELSELNMTIDVPADWITFTRDIDENDPNLEQMGTTAETLISTYETNSIYLNAVCLNPLSEIVITMVSDKSTQSIYDFNLISDEDMPEAAESIRTEMQEIMGDAATYTESSIYTHTQAKFAVFNFETSGEFPDHAQQYTTIINGQTINVTLHSYTGQLTAAQEQLLKDVVDSITFTKVTKKPWLDVSRVMMSAIIGGISGAIAVVIVALVKKHKRRKAAAESSTVVLHTDSEQHSDDSPYLK